MEHNKQQHEDWLGVWGRNRRVFVWDEPVLACKRKYHREQGGTWWAHGPVSVEVGQDGKIHRGES